MSIRIWHQSLTELDTVPGYRAMLERRVAAVADEGTVVDLHGVQPGTYPPGAPPAILGTSRYMLGLVELQVAENCMVAEREGYDVVAISCFDDPALELARGLVDIPVVSICETALLVGSTIGRRLGLLAIDPPMAHTLETLATRYSAQGRVITIQPLDPPVDEFELDRAFDADSALMKRMEDQARRIVAMGADVIVPAENLINSLFVHHGVKNIGRAPVIDAFAALLGFAEFATRQRRVAGLTTSRAGTYARPADDVLSHVREVTGQVLSRGLPPAAPRPGVR